MNIRGILTVLFGSFVITLLASITVFGIICCPLDMLDIPYNAEIVLQ